MNFSRILNKIKKAIDSLFLRSKVSYAQCGEDLIAAYFFEGINIKKPVYLDIGANHPVKGNNTYLFYLNGSRGVCVEPDITLIPALKKKRSRDLILNMGIAADQTSMADFYSFNGYHSAWNTFLKADADIKMKESGIPYSISKVKLDSVKNILQNNTIDTVNFISIDVEGWDLEILKSIDFSVVKPELICVETIFFSMNNTLKKNHEIIEYMQTRGYKVYADTNLNTLFCRSDLFKTE
jgi:FkbM family methyltransferase